ncbi:hypothetical protein A5882_003489 [Enterococcus sp. 4E1_DIV0656]|nr:hypothetical protein A5882_003489 [Enterococcus sp. 4E1_DIV0656]
MDPIFARLHKIIKSTICKYKGHNYAVYPYYYKNDPLPEMAGECTRCGHDTHEDLHYLPR